MLEEEEEGLSRKSWLNDENLPYIKAAMLSDFPPICANGHISTGLEETRQKQTGRSDRFSTLSLNPRWLARTFLFRAMAAAASEAVATQAVASKGVETKRNDQIVLT